MLGRRIFRNQMELKKSVGEIKEFDENDGLLSANKIEKFKPDIVTCKCKRKMTMSAVLKHFFGNQMFCPDLTAERV